MNLPSGGIGRSEGQKIVGDLATTRKESKSEGIEEIKKNVVEELAASPKVDKKIGLKDFTHMFSSRTRNTGYEGGHEVDKYKYWYDLIPHLKDHVSKDTLEAMTKVINDGLSLLEGGITPERVKSAIRNLNPGESVYVPSGWSAHPSGHFCILKFTKNDDGSVQFYSINKGGGIVGNHQVLIDGVRQKYDFRSNCFKMNKENLLGIKGDSFFEKLISLKTMPVSADSAAKQYDGDDLYGLLTAYADDISALDENEVFHVTPQRTGNCTQASIFCAFTDAEASLTKGSISKDTFRIAHFKMKQETLVVAFQQYRHSMATDPDPDQLFLFRDAVREHLTRALKLKDKIPEKEFLKAEIIGNEIIKELNKFENDAKAKTATAVPSVQCSASPLKPSLPDSVESEGKLTTASEYEAAVRTVDHLVILDALKIDDLLTYIKRNIALAKVNLERGYNPVEIFNEISLLVDSLPDSRDKIEGEDEYVYDKLNEEKSVKLVALLRELNETAMKCLLKVQSGTKSVKINGKVTEITKITIDKGKLFEISLKTYDIAAQVAPNIRELKLEEYEGFSFDPSVIKDTGKLTDPKTQLRLDKVKSNFEERNKLTDSAREKLKKDLAIEMLKKHKKGELIAEAEEEKTKRLLFPKSISSSNASISKGPLGYLKRIMGEKLYEAVVDTRRGVEKNYSI